jgi:stearoyl-CoA desaturase (delta-9 desaturase)
MDNIEFRRFALFGAQVICHILTIYAFFIFSGIDWFKAFAVYSVTASLGISVGFHRLLSHKSFETKRIFEMIAILAGTYGLVGSSLAWVNTHRTHHRFTDKQKDPHSPFVLGFVKAQWLSMFSSPASVRYVPDLLRDKFQIFLHKKYYLIHLLIATILSLMFGLKGMMTYYAVPACLLWNMGSLVNTICHSRFGYRNYETKDRSVNNPIFGLLVFGEGWHNNHHGDPKNKKFSRKWYEVDLSYAIIRLIKNGTTSKDNIT